mgnify:CR=1 FL=1
MKEAQFYKKIQVDTVQCLLCPHFCVVKNRQRGKCRVRENQGGKLVSLVYGKLCSIAIDPIEKKPLYHFLPGTKSFSVGTAGCNLKCMFCQNWRTSQANPDQIPARRLNPDDVVYIALEKDCRSISFTYNEPGINYEFVYETSKLAKQKHLKTVMVTNGFLNPEPVKQLAEHIDAVNIDFKAFDEEFYKQICGARLKPVLEAIKLYKERGVWLELTNLLIPEKNDDMAEFENLVKWIQENLGRQTPLHISRFFPMYRMQDSEPTPEKTLMNAKKIAENYLEYVYAGNIATDSNTYCPNCRKCVIQRKGFSAELYFKENNCPVCGKELEGVWQ